MADSFDDLSFLTSVSWLDNVYLNISAIDTISTSEPLRDTPLALNSLSDTSQPYTGMNDTSLNYTSGTYNPFLNTHYPRPTNGELTQHSTSPQSVPSLTSSLSSTSTTLTNSSAPLSLSALQAVPSQWVDTPQTIYGATSEGTATAPILTCRDTFSSSNTGGQWDAPQSGRETGTWDKILEDILNTSVNPCVPDLPYKHISQTVATSTPCAEQSQQVGISEAQLHPSQPVLLKDTGRVFLQLPRSCPDVVAKRRPPYAERGPRKNVKIDMISPPRQADSAAGLHPTRHHGVVQAREPSMYPTGPCPSRKRSREEKVDKELLRKKKKKKQTPVETNAPGATPKGSTQKTKHSPHDYVTAFGKFCDYQDKHYSQKGKDAIQDMFSRTRKRDSDRTEAELKEGKVPLFNIAQYTSKDAYDEEAAFQHTRKETSHVFDLIGSPACLWRRSGEIYAASKEFAALVNIPFEKLQDGSTCIYEVMDEKSTVQYWEDYNDIRHSTRMEKACMASTVLMRNGDNKTRDAIPCNYFLTLKQGRVGTTVSVFGIFLPQ